MTTQTLTDEKSDKKEVIKTGIKALQDETNLETIKGYNFWVKFASVLLFVLGGLWILYGLIMIITIIGIIITIIYVPLGVLYIFMGIKLWESATTISKVDASANEEELVQNLFNGLSTIKTYFKIAGITAIVAISIILIFLILGIGLLFLNFGNYSSQLKDNQNLNSTMQPTTPVRRN
jgi:hypothetical protein